jgi:hypothetical protein
MIKFNEYNTKRDLLEVAKKIKHSGDYGSLFWNSLENKVHWTMADGDGYSSKYDLTSEDEIKRLFKGVAGVKEVQIGDEWSPKGEGWERLRYR